LSSSKFRNKNAVPRSSISFFIFFIEDIGGEFFVNKTPSGSTSSAAILVVVVTSTVERCRKYRARRSIDVVFPPPPVKHTVKHDIEKTELRA
jgi:hypothetical protein